MTTQGSTIVIQPADPQDRLRPRLQPLASLRKSGQRHGRDGIRTPGSGMAARIFPSVAALESVSSEAMAGAGRIGDLIGTTGLSFITTTATTRTAIRFA